MDALLLFGTAQCRYLNMFNALQNSLPRVNGTLEGNYVIFNFTTASYSVLTRAFSSLTNLRAVKVGNGILIYPQGKSGELSPLFFYGGKSIALRFDTASQKLPMCKEISNSGNSHLIFIIVGIIILSFTFILVKGR